MKIRSFIPLFALNYYFGFAPKTEDLSWILSHCFWQTIEKVNRSIFKKSVKEKQTKGGKGFDSWTHLLAMFLECVIFTCMGFFYTH